MELVAVCVGVCRLKLWTASLEATQLKLKDAGSRMLKSTRTFGKDKKKAAENVGCFGGENIERNMPKSRT